MLLVMQSQECCREPALDLGQPELDSVFPRREECILTQVERARLEVRLERPGQGHEYDIPKQEREEGREEYAASRDPAHTMDELQAHNEEETDLSKSGL